MPRGVPNKKTATRLDPAPRPIDGGAPYFNVRNKDPGREYVWVYKAAQDFGIDHYADLGYRVEKYSETGPCPAMAVIDPETGEPVKPNGTVIERRGNVLMSVSKERWNDIYQNGSDGVSGQKAADVVDRRMLDTSRQEKDSMRGLNPRREDYLRAEGIRGSIAAIPTGDEDG